jgi:hypothetical protein
MKIRIQRDQAVWERETFEVEVPDDFDPNQDDHVETLHETLENLVAPALPSYSLKILDAVLGISTETTLIMPDGREVDL